MAAAGGLEQWWKEIPLLTRWGFGAAFFFTLSANFGLISPMYLTLDWDRIVRGFEIWRIITCFPFMGRLGLPFLMNMVLFYRYSSFVEDTTFKGRTADYLWMWICGALLLLAFGLYFGYPILGMGLIMMVIYYWSRKNPDGVVTFMFGLKFQSIYLPWVMLAFTILLGGIPIMEFVGIIIGHVYWFLENVAPQVYGWRLIRTPAFLYDLFPRQYNQMAPAAQNRPAGHQWGQGHALGARR